MRLLAGVVAAALAWHAVPAAVAQEERLDALRERIDRLREQIAGTEESRVEARDQLRDSERAISEANRSLRSLAERRAEAARELAVLSEQRAALESEVGARREQLGRLLSARYRGGEQGYLRLLLTGEDPNRAARELRYYAYVSRAQADFIKALRGDLDRLRTIESLAREKSAELAGIETAQRDQRTSLLQTHGERRKVLERISAQLRGRRKEVKSLERDEARLTRLVRELGRVIGRPAGNAPRNERVPESGRDDTAFAELKGKLRLPIRGELANRFGTRRSEGGPQWSGLFIRATAGQEVRAVAAGRVVFADWMRGFGNLLILDHGAGYLSIYGNNESVLKSVGDRIRTGDVVATVGASGGAAGSGLYFEIRLEGKPFDPLQWVSLK